MPGPFQSAINEALSELEQSAGKVFYFAGAKLKAWPVKSPELEVGRVLASQAQHFWYEAKAYGSPVFKIGAELVDDDGVRYSVAARYHINPNTGVFKFAILSGRLG